MSPISSYYAVLILFTVIPDAISAGSCRNLEFRAQQIFIGTRLLNHVIFVTDVKSEDVCRILCYTDSNCISYNFKTENEIGKHKCELNNATHDGNEDDLEENPNYIYRGATNLCLNSSCKNNATCQTGFTERGYRCLCFYGFTGQDCETDIDECATGTHSCDVNADCINTKGSNNCTCKPGYQGDGQTCEDIDECATGQHNCSALEICNNNKGSFDCPSLTCKAIYDSNLSRVNMAYQIAVGSEIAFVYCHLSTAGLGECGTGGWTLVMKIDGAQSTFHYNSAFWTNKQTFNPTGGETGFDTQQTKLATYWNTSFTKVCLGIKIPGEENVYFIVINRTGDSLYSLIADGQFRATSLGRNRWKQLLGSQASLQLNCNKEGFNVASYNLAYSKARIGILGNNEDQCSTCDSRIGFGTGGNYDNSNTCGNFAAYRADNGNKNIKAMGYIFVQ